MFSQVCKAWYILAQHDLLWRPHLLHLALRLGLGLEENLQTLQPSIGRLVVDGKLTYKYLYEKTFCLAVRTSVLR
jgi:hypothetical protein